MRRILAFAAACAMACSGTVVMAQERAGDAAMGAVSGAVVLGPVGAVAGAVIGYTSGPAISRAWKRHSGHRPPSSVSAAAQPSHGARPGTSAPKTAARSAPPAAAPSRSAASPSASSPAQSFE